MLYPAGMREKGLETRESERRQSHVCTCLGAQVRQGVHMPVQRRPAGYVSRTVVTRNLDFSEWGQAFPNNRGLKCSRPRFLSGTQQKGTPILHVKTLKPHRVLSSVCIGVHVSNEGVARRCLLPTARLAPGRPSIPRFQLTLVHRYFAAEAAVRLRGGLPSARAKNTNGRAPRERYNPRLGCPAEVPE